MPSRLLCRRDGISLLQELYRGDPSQGAVRAVVVVCDAARVTESSCQASMILLASGTLRKYCTFRHSSRKQPFKLSMCGLSVGLPGRVKARSTPRLSACSARAQQTNSGPLSTSRRSGNRRLLAKLSKP